MQRKREFMKMLKSCVCLNSSYSILIASFAREIFSLKISTLQQVINYLSSMQEIRYFSHKHLTHILFPENILLLASFVYVQCAHLMGF